jgi:hypothetical protein
MKIGLGARARGFLRAAVIASVATVGCALALTPGQRAVLFAGQSIIQILGFTPTSVFNIVDYGAKCNGQTDDTNAINNTFSAAKQSYAYINGGSVEISGPGRGVSCVITSINATNLSNGFNSSVIFENFNGFCSGSGNICLDSTGSINFNPQNITITGSSSSPPAIGYQNGNYHIGSLTCCVGSDTNVQVLGHYTFAALYSVAAESVSYYGSIFRNDGTTTGPIAALGSLSGGSGYVNGTYLGVVLTGGSGTDPAIATVVVSGNAVVSVTMIYQGKGYTQGDALSAISSSIGGAGSGFIISVVNISPYGCVFDGENHWNSYSAYLTVLSARDFYSTFSEVNMFAGSCRFNGSATLGSALWMGATNDFQFYRTYFNTTASAPIVQLFDNGVAPNATNKFDVSAEGGNATYSFWLYGSNATPVLENTTLRAIANQANTAVFGTDANITKVSMPGATIQLPFPTVQAFSNASLWNISGSVYIHALREWNAPASFNGQFCGIGASGTSFPCGNVGPLDILNGASAAYSCSRQLTVVYTGPLCNVERASDSTSVDMYADGFGNLDRGAFQSFCANTTCSVKTAYDQSGNSNSATQSTAADQPVLAIASSSFNGQATMTWAGAGATSLVATEAASINNVFSAGGYATVVVNQNNPVNSDRILFKANSGETLGWDFRQGSVNNRELEFVQTASTSNSIWTTGVSETNAPHVIDLQYNSSSDANAPTMSVDGIARPNSTNNTPPVGAVTTDAAQNLIIGNNVASGGTRGYSGNISEIIIWASIPTALQLESIRRNEAAYYGVAAVQ